MIRDIIYILRRKQYKGCTEKDSENIDNFIRHTFYRLFVTSITTWFKHPIRRITCEIRDGKEYKTIHIKGWRRFKSGLKRLKEMKEDTN